MSGVEVEVEIEEAGFMAGAVGCGAAGVTAGIAFVLTAGGVEVTGGVLFTTGTAGLMAGLTAGVGLVWELIGDSTGIGWLDIVFGGMSGKGLFL